MFSDAVFHSAGTESSQLTVRFYVNWYVMKEARRRNEEKRQGSRTIKDGRCT